MADRPAPALVFSRESKFRPERFLDITPSRQPSLIKGVLPARGVAFLVGASKAGKSFLGIDGSLRIASGAPTVWGRKAKTCGVAYVGAEDPDGCRNRITAWRKRHRQDHRALPFEFIGQALNVLDEDDMADLRTTLLGMAALMADDGHRLGLVVFDTLSRCIPGVDENNSVDMSRAFTALDRLGRELGVLILIVAHFGKSGAERGIRGWSGMDANSDATITLERDADDPDLRTLTFAKVKNGVDGGKLSFRLESVDLGITDEDGDPISSCVPAYEQAPDGVAKPKKRRALSAPALIVLQALKHVTDHGATHPIPPNVAGAKPYWRAVTSDDVRARAKTTGLAADGDKPNTVNVRFNRALEAVVASGAARQEGNLIILFGA